MGSRDAAWEGGEQLVADLVPLNGLAMALWCRVTSVVDMAAHGPHKSRSGIKMIRDFAGCCCMVLVAMSSQFSKIQVS